MTPREPAPRPVVIGLAGAVGAGKSLAAEALERRGCLVINADQLVHEMLKDDRVLQRIENELGSGLTTRSGDLDRRALADRVFADPEARRRLESILHPPVIAECRDARARARREGRPAAVIDAPLLFEAALDDLCDLVIFIDAPIETRLERVRRDRGWTAEELHRREHAQLPPDEKRRRSHAVVLNDGTADQLDNRVRHIFDTLTTRANLDPRDGG